MFANLAPATVGETSGEGMDLWRPGRDLESEGSVCWNRLGNKDIGVICLGIVALGHIGPAATASFKAGLGLDDLGVAHPDGSFLDNSLFSPPVMRSDGCFRLPIGPIHHIFDFASSANARTFHCRWSVSPFP